MTSGRVRERSREGVLQCERRKGEALGGGGGRLGEHSVYC